MTPPPNPVGGWMPIESAPRTGEAVLIAGGIFSDDDCLFGGHPFEGITIATFAPRAFCLDWCGERCGGHDEFRRHAPTHYQPLPPPPEREGG